MKLVHWVCLRPIAKCECPASVRRAPGAQVMPLTEAIDKHRDREARFKSYAGKRLPYQRGAA